MSFKHLKMYARVECVYRLLISSLAVQWKSYLMATDSYLFSFLMTNDQECFAMCLFYSFLSLGSRIHYAGGTVIRQASISFSFFPTYSAIMQVLVCEK